MIHQQLVSILMPARNASSFIIETIFSIQSQTHELWELIVVDDFSDDETFHLVQNLALTDSRISVFRNKKRGIVPALSLAFELSSGTFITRMDADDLMVPNKLSTLLSLLDNTELTIATGKSAYFGEHVSDGYKAYEMWLNSNLESDNPFREIYRECIIASPNWMVKRDCFEKDISLRALTYPEDYDMVFQWYQKGYKISYSPSLTHLWREHPERTSRNSERYQQPSFFELKTNRFIDNELVDEPVQVIGTGKKGKLVKTIFDQRGIEYQVYDLQPNESSKVLSVQDLNPNLKTVLTNWPKENSRKEQVRAFMQSKGFTFGKNCWLF